MTTAQFQRIVLLINGLWGLYYIKPASGAGNNSAARVVSKKCNVFSFGWIWVNTKKLLSSMYHSNTCPVALHLPVFWLRNNEGFVCCNELPSTITHYWVFPGSLFMIPAGNRKNTNEKVILFFQKRCFNYVLMIEFRNPYFSPFNHNKDKKKNNRVYIQ